MPGNQTQVAATAPKETRPRPRVIPFNEQPWQALLDSAGEGIWGVDLDGNCTFVNRAALGMLGFAAEELLGKNMHAMVHHHYPDGEPYPAEACVVYNVFRQNQPFSNQIDHLFRKDGSMFWADTSAQPIVDGQRLRGAVVTFRDITQARLTEQALRRSEKLAAVGQLASSIAHEINNPLESVTNLLYLIRDCPSLADVKTYAALAELELARVNDITIQTLRFHRQQARAAPLDLSDVLPAILRLYASRFHSRQIQVELQLTPTPPVHATRWPPAGARAACDRFCSPHIPCIRNQLAPAQPAPARPVRRPHHHRRYWHRRAAAHARAPVRTLPHQ
jgi:PAS domain S-box-containing protein